MLHRLILKVTKFQLPPIKRLSTVIKNIFLEGGGGGGGCQMPPCQLGLTHHILSQAIISFEISKFFIFGHIWLKFDSGDKLYALIPSLK